MKKYLVFFLPTLLSLAHFVIHIITEDSGVGTFRLVLNFIINPICFLILVQTCVIRWNLKRWVVSFIVFCSSIGNVALGYWAWRIATSITMGGQAVFFYYEYLWAIGSAVVCIFSMRRLKDKTDYK